jgi:surface protein
MDWLFYQTDFNGDISQWDVSNVTSMRGMFDNSLFNGNISRWNVSRAENMVEMFQRSPFNGDISRWNISSAKKFDFMFKNCPFEHDLSNWKLPETTLQRAFDTSWERYYAQRQKETLLFLTESQPTERMRKVL